MTRTISESYEQNSNNSSLNESLINFNMRDLAEYVAKEDSRIKAMCEQLEFNINEDYSNVEVDRLNKMYSVKEGNETLKIFLKQSIVNNMDSYFKYRF